MRIPIRFRSDLTILVGLALLAPIVIFVVPLQIPRIIAGLPYVCFVPGYALLAALYPSSESLKQLDRMALSLGLGIAILFLIGLLLNYTPFGLRLESIVFSITVFVFVCCGAAYQRHAKLAPNRRSMVLDIEWMARRWHESSFPDKGLSVTLVILILIAVGTFAYAATRPRAGEVFTEFYILGSGNALAGLPTDVGVGEPIHVIIGIANHEQRYVRYRLERVGYTPQYIASATLAPDQTWEQTYTFVLDESTENGQVVFLLYKEDSKVPYRSLWLRITVREKPPGS